MLLSEISYKPTNVALTVKSSEDEFWGKCAEILVQKCSTFVKAYSNREDFLYRGIKDGGGIDFLHQPIRPDRKPVQMAKDIHELSHEAMLSLGLKATRKNSIFCSADGDTASYWGSTYIIFPEDGWVGTIFENTRGIYTFSDIEDAGGEILDKKEARAEQVKQMGAALEKLKPASISTTADIERVLDKKYTDILITGKGYYALKLGSKLMYGVLGELGLE